MTCNICSLYARPFIREVHVEEVMGQEGEESSPHSLSFLTLITRLQIHSAFSVRRSAKYTPSVNRRKTAQVVRWWPSRSKGLMFPTDRWPSSSNGLMFPMNGWPELFERNDFSNEWVIKSFERADVSTNGWPSRSNGFIFLTNGYYAPVNSTCAQHPPGLTPGHWHFFCLGWQIPGGGDSWAVKSPGVGTEKEGKCPVLRQRFNIFHWSHSRIVPF